MKLQLSKLVQDMIKKPSPIRRIMKMADRQNMLSMGVDPEKVISFGGGWVNHEAPEELRKKYIEIVSDKKKFHKSGGYSPTPGETDCREAIAYFEREIFGVKLSWNNVLIGQSSTQITHDVFITIANPGDALLLLDPTYANYYGQAVFALPSARLLVEPGHIEKPIFDANLVYLNVFNPKTWRYLEDMNETIEKFKKMMDIHKPKAVLVPSPDNPTSQIPKHEFVQALLEITKDKGAYLIIDHAYKAQYFSEEMPRYFSWSPAEHENLITLHSNSKWGRGLGRRLGWVEAHETVIDGMERTQQCSVLCPDTLHQMALTEYFNESIPNGELKRYLDKTREEYRKTAKVTLDAIDKYLGMKRLAPEGGLYIVMDVGRDGNEFTMDVLKNTGVLFVPGEGFGASLKNGVRISYGPWINNHQKIIEGIERVGKYLNCRV